MQGVDILEGYPGTEGQLTAWIEWRDAEKAYQALSSHFVVAWWEREVPPSPQLPLTSEAFERLRELRAAVQSKQDAYRVTL